LFSKKNRYNTKEKATFVRSKDHEKEPRRVRRGEMHSMGGREEREKSHALRTQGGGNQKTIESVRQKG